MIRLRGAGLLFGGCHVCRGMGFIGFRGGADVQSSNCVFITPVRGM